MDDTGKDFVVAAHRDGRGEMRDAVKVVHSAIKGVDNPLAVAGPLCIPLFTQDGMAGMPGQNVVLDEALGSAIEFEFDVVSVHGIDLERLFEVFAEQFAGEECGIDGRGEEFGHV